MLVAEDVPVASVGLDIFFLLRLQKRWALEAAGEQKAFSDRTTWVGGILHGV